MYLQIHTRLGFIAIWKSTFRYQIWFSKNTLQSYLHHTSNVLFIHMTLSCRTKICSIFIPSSKNLLTLPSGLLIFEIWDDFSKFGLLFLNSIHKFKIWYVLKLSKISNIISKNWRVSSQNKFRPNSVFSACSGYPCSLLILIRCLGHCYNLLLLPSTHPLHFRFCGVVTIHINFIVIRFIITDIVLLT